MGEKTLMAELSKEETDHYKASGRGEHLSPAD